MTHSCLPIVCPYFQETVLSPTDVCAYSWGDYCEGGEDVTLCVWYYNPNKLLCERISNGSKYCFVC